MNRRDFLKLSAKAAALASSGGLLLLPEIVLADDSRFW
ncbi:TPA: twin-arginine translocation signal domain-containing protein, partial [Neisseria gonorrhoeae]